MEDVITNCYEPFHELFKRNRGLDTTTIFTLFTFIINFQSVRLKCNAVEKH